jgi:CRP/FNR family cyclic AMP-dependent transcriptional regulator
MSKASFILSELDEADIEWMVAHGSKKNLPAHTVLIQENEKLEALYIVMSGTLMVYVSSYGDREINQIGSGEILGEMSFVDGSLPSATVKSVTPCQVLSIPCDLLVEKLDQDVPFSLRFYRAITKFLSTRLRGTVNLLSATELSLTQSLTSATDEEEDDDTDQAHWQWLIERLQDV